MAPAVSMVAFKHIVRAREIIGRYLPTDGETDDVDSADIADAIEHLIEDFAAELAGEGRP